MPESLLLNIRNCCLLLSVVLAGCAGSAPKVVGIGSWGAAERVVASGNLFFSGQPDAAGLDAAKAAGVVAVINLRQPEELDWNEQAAVEGAGLEYYNVPLDMDDERLDERSVREITRVVEAFGERGVLLHCASGNRVAAWWAMYLMEQGVDRKTAVRSARRAGLTHAELEQRVLASKP